MSSRLDRLFLLLDQGSSQVTRKAAALQLGEVQKFHPHELNNLLIKVRQYLHSNSWDTRIAASQAVEAIIRNVEPWFPFGSESSGEDCVKKENDDASSGRMLFSKFDINTVIKYGKDLLASEGSEYDVKTIETVGLESDSFKDKLANQRRLLNQRLGLDVAEKLNLGVTSEDMISNDDLAQVAIKKEVAPKMNLEDALDKATGNTKRKNTSAREKANGVNLKKIKKEEPTDEVPTDRTIDFSTLEEWPLESFSDELMSDLFSASWEIRHGAATALREIVKQQGKCAGRVASAPSNEMDSLNQIWLEDLALRLLCVLALDKFGDYVSDQVVAPVRETCAQALGSVFNVMTKANVESTLKILIKLLERPEWEARHGGLLGLKYMLAVRQDMTSELLPLVFDPIFGRLKVC